MFSFLFSNLKKGIQKISENPQLIYTILVALIITASFVFMAGRFISIANDASERLVNVRIGSLQDAFVSFAGDRINDTEYLNGKIQNIVSKNETIKSFEVVAKKEIQNPSTGMMDSAYMVLASSDTLNVGRPYTADTFLYTLATSDPNNSLTVQFIENGERMFKTARAITDTGGNILGVVMTVQTLSLADLVIEKNIQNSRILLFAIIILILFLFFRLSKIIDYMELYNKLKEVDQLKDDFISMASHELRTPLTIIRGYAEFAGNAPELTPETKENVSKIDMFAKQLDALISDILDVSRMEQGRMSFNFTKVNPSETVQGVVESLVLPAKEKGLAISFDKSKVEDSQLVNVDIDRLKQVLVNIVGNAVKYTVKGEVTVRQYTEKDRVHIRVSDTGLGMTEEERKKLFGKFYRIRNKETQDIRGTGLGLWITARIVKEMEGTISVESIKGVGSHFIVSFPKVA